MWWGIWICIEKWALNTFINCICSIFSCLTIFLHISKTCMYFYTISYTLPSRTPMLTSNSSIKYFKLPNSCLKIQQYQNKWGSNSRVYVYFILSLMYLFTLTAHNSCLLKSNRSIIFYVMPFQHTIHFIINEKVYYWLPLNGPVINV